MKNKEYNIVVTIPNSNIKNVEGDKFDATNTHDISLSWLGTDIKSGGVELVLWAQTSDPS
jgi:hypothetical protein